LRQLFRAQGEIYVINGFLQAITHADIGFFDWPASPVGGPVRLFPWQRHSTACHLASKLSESMSSVSGPDRTSGFFVFVVAVCVTGSVRLLSERRSVLLETDRTSACAGHRNNDFEILLSPSYQHFRPSISR
jgi:hypothetical protein